MKQQHLQNLKALRGFLAGVPQYKLDLSEYMHDCGTVFCAAGWIPHIAHFQKLGVMAGYFGEPILGDLTDVDGDEIDDTVNALFGDFADYCTDHGCRPGTATWHLLFSPRHNGLHDEAIMQAGEYMSDKDLALARLDYAIALMQQDQPENAQ